MNLSARRGSAAAAQWRQAGRALPEYRKVRETATLLEITRDAALCAEVTLQPVRRLGVDLRRLDFAVISHRHADHTGGLAHLLRVNPAVTIFGGVPALLLAALGVSDRWWPHVNVGAWQEVCALLAKNNAKVADRVRRWHPVARS